MSFDRHRAQLLCESLLGCNTFDEFFRADFDTLTLDNANAFQFSSVLKDDAKDFFYKGYISLEEGLNAFAQRNYSWGVVKLYYSVFYMLRSDLAIRDYGLIRHRTMYYLQAKNGSSPITKGKQGSNRTNYAGDHKSTINYYKDLFGNTDILLSQNIDGYSAYEWLIKKRERINYQERVFNEPGCSDFLEYINEEIQYGNFLKLIEEILNDPYIKTFQPEYSPIAIPIKRAILTRKNFSDNNIKLSFDENKLIYLKSNNTVELFTLDD